MAEIIHNFPICVTNSMASDYLRCPYLWWQKYILRIGPQEQSIHLAAGGAIAAGLADARKAFYQDGVEREQAEFLGFKRIMREWSYHDFGEDGPRPNKSLGQAVNAYYDYHDKFPMDTTDIKPVLYGPTPAIEFSFSIPTPILHPQSGEPILFEGTLDMIAGMEDTDKAVLVDEKTCQFVSDSWLKAFALRSQFIGYTYAAQHFKWPIHGVLVRGIVMKRAGGIEFVSPFYQYDKHMITEWWLTFSSVIQDMVDTYKQLRYPRKALGDACSAFAGCAFQDRCLSPTPERVPGFEVKKRLYFENEEDF